MRSAPWMQPVTKREVNALFAEGGPASPSLRAALTIRPEFRSAARKTAAGLVALHVGNPLLNRIINDRGRMFVSLFVLDLHFRGLEDGIGLTPGRLKDLCRVQNVCSATRCQALLALMKLGGYLQSAPSASDQRRRRLIATEKLIDAQRDRWRCHLQHAAPLLPDAARALEWLDRTELIQGLIRLICSHMRAGFRFIDHMPSLKLFGERNGGMFALCAMVVGADRDGPGQPVAVEISVSDLARRTSTSRAHIVKLLKDAESEGLLQRESSSGVELSAALVSDLYDFFALNYLVMAHFSKITIDHFEET